MVKKVKQPLCCAVPLFLGERTFAKILEIMLENVESSIKSKNMLWWLWI